MENRTSSHINHAKSLHSSIATGSEEMILQQFYRNNPTGGALNFCLLREPKFFSALEVEGSKNDVLLVSDSSGLAGVGLISEKDVFINGRKEKLGYYSGLRIVKEYQGSNCYLRMARIARELHANNSCKVYLANVFADNSATLDTFIAQGRTYPSFRSAGDYHTFIFSAYNQIPDKIHHDHLVISKTVRSDIKDLVAFLNKQGEFRQFFPCYTDNDFLQDGGLLKGLSAENILIARHNNMIVGTMALWDQNSFRHWMIKSYSGLLSFMRPMANVLASLGHRPVFPSPGEAINYQIISLCCIDEKHPEAFTLLINNLLKKIKWDKSVYAAIGIHQSDPLLKLFRFPAVRLLSRLYKVYWPEDSRFAQLIDDRLPYFELGSL